MKSIRQDFLRPTPGWLVGGVVLVLIFNLLAQISVTPLGEGMDVFGHWGYVGFLAAQRRAPRPGEPALPAQVGALQAALPAPDQTLGERYAAWAKMSLAERAQVRAQVLTPVDWTTYSQPNYEAQHPPLYYAVLAEFFPLVGGLPPDVQVFWLAFLSVLIASAGLPGVYRLLRLYVSPRTAVLGCLAAAVFPNLAPFLARITNDTLAFALLPWLFYFLLRPRKQKYADIILSGLLLVMGFFTKSYFLTLVPVYLAGSSLSVSLAGGAGGKWRFDARRLGLSLSLAAGGAALLVIYNVQATGSWLGLTEMQTAGAFTLADQLRALVTLDPIWFFVRGLLRLAWWSGFWSFVSPGILYYLPELALIGLLVLKLPRRRTLEGFLGMRRLWPFYLAAGGFVAGMLWHAALFKLRATLVAGQVQSGNEGWYLDVLLGPFAVIWAVLVAERFSGKWAGRLAWGLPPFLLVLGLLGRLTAAMFWTGQVRMAVFIRSANLGDVLRTVLSPQEWESWLSLPGVLRPAWFTAGLPLLLAVGLLAWVLLAVRTLPAESIEG